jgi:S-adenosyl methyltransferase
MADPNDRMSRYIDITTPSVARMYDFYLGGKDNFAIDRETAAKALEQAPELPMMAREGRRFLGRVVRFLVESGIRQFVDIGSGLPTQRNVHEIAQSYAPEARIAYVDNDPIVLAHARALLSGNGLATVIEGDMAEPDRILEAPALRRLIDLERPVAFLLMSVLHLVPDDDLANHIAARLRDAMVPGGYLAVSHAVSDLRPTAASRIASLYQATGAVANGPRRELRKKADVEPFFGDLEMVEPGLVYLPQWRPDLPGATEASAPVWVVGGVGRRR